MIIEDLDAGGDSMAGPFGALSFYIEINLWGGGASGMRLDGI